MKLSNLLICVSIVLALCVGPVLAETLSEVQKSFIDRVLKERGLNIYGDPEGTIYPGGNPLFDETTGVSTDRHEFVLRQHPDILEGFVEVLPVPGEGVAKVLETTAKLRNDFDARRVPARHLSALADADAAIAQLVQSIRVAVDAQDHAALHALFRKVSDLSDDQLLAFASVLKATRRMLQMPTIQPIETTAQVRELLRMLDALELRLFVK